MATPSVDTNKVQAAADAYAEKIFTNPGLDFHIEELCGLDAEAADPIYTAVHEQVVAAFTAGYMARVEETGGAL